jgi:hypothetical protein
MIIKTIKLIICFLFISCSLKAYSPHRFYIGPDVYYRDYDEILDAPAKSHEFGALYGFQLGYDYINNCSCYFGLDLRYSGGKTIYDGSLMNFETSEISPYTSRTINDFFNFELRFGRTYQLKQLTLIPFAAIGYHSWYRGMMPNDPYGYDEDYSWCYTAIGLRTDYKLNSRFSIGWNVKLMYMSDATMTSSDLDNITFNLGQRFQSEIELPITYNLNKNCSFLDQIAFVPYYRNQNIGQSDYKAVVTENNTILYFVEPSSKTHVGGFRIEFRKYF